MKPDTQGYGRMAQVGTDRSRGWKQGWGEMGEERPSTQQAEAGSHLMYPSVDATEPEGYAKFSYQGPRPSGLV